VTDGWIGPAHQVMYYLSTVGADRDEHGNYLLVSVDETGDGPSSFMGMGEELVIPGGVAYLVNGRPVRLAAGLRSTSYGLGVQVV
jgi:hypothetical protein